MNLASFLIYCIVVTFTPGPSNIVNFFVQQRWGAKNDALCVGSYVGIWSAAYRFSFS